MRKNCLNYPIEFADDLFAAGGDVLADVLRSVTGTESPRVMMVADLNVVQRTEGLGTRIGAWVRDRGVALAGSPIVLGGGEKIKGDGFQSALRIVSAALAPEAGRVDALVVIGGGSVIDVAGWAAAQVRGGLKTVRIPTTVAAMVDSAYAETAALNLTGRKDVLCVPCPPAAVVIDLGFAHTVLDGVWRGGFAEALRVAAACDATLLKRLLELSEAFRGRDDAALAEVVRAVVKVRRSVPVPPLALWGAVRLEEMSGYKLPHGYAVALGLMLDAAYAVCRGQLPEETRAAWTQALSASGVLDGAAPSRHLLSRSDDLLAGLDAWAATRPGAGFCFPAGDGRCASEEFPDKDTMKAALDLIK